MDGLAYIISASVGLNLFILGVVLINSRRIGKIEGGLQNGGFTRCPFYKGHIDREVRANVPKKATKEKT